MDWQLSEDIKSAIIKGYESPRDFWSELPFVMENIDNLIDEHEKKKEQQ